VLLTEDAGRTWQVRTSGRAESLSAVRFIDAQHGVAVGEGGTVLLTEDAGRSWQARPSSTAASLWSVHFGDAQHGAAVGYGAQVRTDDGGRTWQSVNYGRWPAHWYWLSCAGFLALLWPTGRIAERPISDQAPQRTVADEYVSDRPARSAAEDRLGFAPRVDGLSRYLRNLKTEPPLTLAITGPWGSGKSSFMRLLQEDLERHGGSTVWFNAWHHQKEEHLQAALLAAVRRQAVPSMFWIPGIVFRAKLFWERAKSAPGWALLGAAFVAAAAAYLFMKPAQGTTTQGQDLLTAVSCIADPPKGPTEAEKLAAAVDRLNEATARVARGQAEVIKPAAEKKSPEQVECDRLIGEKPAQGWISTGWRFLLHGKAGQGLLVLLLGVLPVLKAAWGLRAFGMDPAVLKATLAGQGDKRALSKETNFRYRFAQEFDTVSQALRPAVLTIFIDDLDRCNEQQVMELLEAVNYLVESGRCFVVLGMVEETVERLVGLAFERVAAELAEQQPHSEEDGKSTEELKREQRKRFAERYLEKLINLRVAVPALDEGGALYLVTGEGQKTDPRTIEVPRWVTWIDIPLAWLQQGWLVVTILMIAGFGVWLGMTLAQKGELVTPATSSAPSALPAGGVVAPPRLPDVVSSSVDLVRRQPALVSLPERLAPANPERTWWNLPVEALVTIFLLASLIGALARRREFHTRDSPAFVRAFAIWTPLVMAKVKTARGLKRFQNRVRFLAMALDAQAHPEPRVPDSVGPLSRWVVEDKLAKLEAHARFNALLPEPVLVALTAFQAVDEKWLEEQALGVVGRDVPSLPNGEYADLIKKTLLEHNKEVGGNWPHDCSWPPDRNLLHRFGAALGLLPGGGPAGTPREAQTLHISDATPVEAS